MITRPAIAAALLVLTLGVPLRAAEITLDPPRVYLSGPIVAGDADRFRGTLAAFPGPFGRIEELHLNSRGGRVAEAMKIGRLVRSLLLDTVAPWDTVLPSGRQVVTCQSPSGPSNACSCASACFYIFAAGVARQGNMLDVHRAFFSRRATAASKLGRYIGEFERSTEEIEGYLQDMGVPRAHIDRIRLIRSDRSWRIPEEEIESFYSGWIPAAEEWLIGSCGGLSEDDEAVNRFEIFTVDPNYGRADEPVEDAIKRQKLAGWRERVNEWRDCVDTALTEQRRIAWQAEFGG